MSALVTALDALSGQHFNVMSSRTCRDALKELAKAPTEAAIAKEVQRLTPAQLDTLVKVVYVGLAADPSASAVFFKWHAAAFEAGGTGAIIRTLTSKAPVTPGAPAAVAA
jgi:hypothetical protein